MMTVKRPLSFILCALPAILCMVLIFAFSAQTAANSSKTSGELIRQSLSILPIGFDDMPAVRQKEIVESLQFIVRKCAHFSVYALLGVLCIPPAHVLLRKWNYAAWAAWGTSALYAVTDEIHQYFVPGRSCELRDVLIDSSGAAVGILLLTIVAVRIRKSRQNNEIKNGRR